MVSSSLISLMVLLPLVGVFFQAISQRQGLHKWGALIGSLSSSFLVFYLLFGFKSETAQHQFSENHEWLKSFSISYEMGVDGLTLMPLLLVAILFPILIAVEWNRKNGVRGLFALLLITQAALIGALCSRDLFVLLLFWTLSAFPFYFLIGIWGDQEKETAAQSTIISSVIGNALFFGALIVVYYASQPQTLSLNVLSGNVLAGKEIVLGGHVFRVEVIAFVLISLGLALRVPVWPIHGWFYRAVEQAPPATIVALAGAVVPVGLYIFTRVVYSLFPSVLAGGSLVVLAIGVANLVVGGVCALAQKNLRGLLAFVCLAQVGMALLGVASQSSAGIVGASFQQAGIGISMAGLGLLLGLILDRAGHVKFVSDSEVSSSLGGVVYRAPLLTAFAAVLLAAVLGLPGSMGFVGQALIVLGAYPNYPTVVIVAGGVFLLFVSCLFSMYRQIFLGPAPQGEQLKAFPDLSYLERGYLFPLVIIFIFLGVYPKLMIELIRPTVLTLLSMAAP